MARLLWLCTFFIGTFIVVQGIEPVGQPLLCEGCIALIKELHKGLKESYGRKAHVTKALASLCHTDNFRVYQFSPPKMVKACHYILETHKPELEGAVIAYYKKFKTELNPLLQENFCDNMIGACDWRLRENKPSGPHGMNLEEANQRLKHFDSEKESVLEAPPLVTPTMKEEL